MDKDIVSWILELLLRQGQVPEPLISKILSNLSVPVDNNNLRLKKTILLRSIDSEISNGSVSETILDSLEGIEEMDRKKNIKVLDSMKVAYCAIAVDCTVKYLWGSRHKRDLGKYSEAVKRIWSGRIHRLEMMKKSELVTDELRNWRKGIVAVLSDSDGYKRLKDRNNQYDALILTGDFVKEAMAIMGPPFLQLVARVEREEKEIVGKGEIGKNAREARDDKEPVEEEARVTTDDWVEPKQREAMVTTDERELKAKELRDTTDEREPKEKEAMEACTEREDIEMADGFQNTTVQELGDVAAGGHGTSGLPKSTSKLVFADNSAPKSPGPKIQRKMLFHNYKRVVELRHFKRPAKLIDSGELNSKTTPTAEVKQTIETLKSSSMELQAAVEDHLPDAVLRKKLGSGDFGWTAKRKFN